MTRADRPALGIRGLSVAAVAAVAAVAVAAVVVVALAGCSGPIMANPAASHDAGPSPIPTRAASSDPRPIRLPRDDAPHDRLTEWWYYTGHLVDEAGRRYGFEYVVFRAERGSLPVTWASHLAVTDEAGGAFHYAQRSEFGPQVDRSPIGAAGPVGFALELTGAGPARPEALGREAWRMAGEGGRDRLTAALAPDEAAAAGSPGGLGLDLELAAVKPATLHDRDGWIDFGPAGGSYYYSRTAMTASGTLDLGGREVQVTGTAWFDHQWGDFIAVGGAGWDWFAVNLSDGTDLALSLVRARDGSYPLVYGTIVDAGGRSRHLEPSAFRVAIAGRWRSPRTGADYPSGWIVELPGEGLRIELTPSVPDQELDTRATTGVVYWEGSQVVRATRDGIPLGGEGYVELMGYGP